MNWNFHLPVELVFGSGTRHEIKSYIEKIGGTRGVLVCGKSFCEMAPQTPFCRRRMAL